ncbi:MAG: hypothetical protein QM692_19745, partial [Thermomicrobiales bacterium]
MIAAPGPLAFQPVVAPLPPLFSPPPHPVARVVSSLRRIAVPGQPRRQRQAAGRQRVAAGRSQQ